MSNGDFFNWNETQDSELVPTSMCLVRIDAVNDGQSSTGKRMPQVRFVIEEPREFANMSHFENFVLGTEEQPSAIVPGAMGTKAFKKLCRAAQVPAATSFQALCAGLKGAKCVVHLVYYEEKDGEYKGTPRNRVAGMGANSGYYKIGEREVRVIEPFGGKGAGGTAGQPAQPAVAAPQPMTAPQPAPQMAPPVGAPPQYASPVPPASGPGQIQPVTEMRAPQATIPPMPSAPPVGAPPAGPNLAAMRHPQVTQPPASLPPGTSKAPAAGNPGSMRCSFCQRDVWAVELAHHITHKQLTGVCPEPGTYIQ